MYTKSTLWLYWNFTLFANEKVKSVTCGYHDASLGKLTELVSRTGASGFAVVPNLPTDYSGRIRVYSSNHTFAIERLMFSDQADYFCKITIVVQVSPLNSQESTYNFDALNLEVKGKFRIDC